MACAPSASTSSASRRSGECLHLADGAGVPHSSFAPVPMSRCGAKEHHLASSPWTPAAAHRGAVPPVYPKPHAGWEAKRWRKFTHPAFFQMDWRFDSDVDQ